MIKTDADAIDLQEQHFVIYAVPVTARGMAEVADELPPDAKYQAYVRRMAKRRLTPGRYAYVINEKGEVHYTKMEHHKYLWPESHVTDYRAAFVDDGTTDTVFNNPLADGQKGFDGNVWHRLKTDEKKPQ